jgi:alpha-D-ribose 1-methylphosphonate 5-triphosphate synthase subunit PhnH
MRWREPHKDASFDDDDFDARLQHNTPRASSNTCSLADTTQPTAAFTALRTPLAHALAGRAAAARTMACAAADDAPAWLAPAVAALRRADVLLFHAGAGMGAPQRKPRRSAALGTFC